jgi:HK97 family phage prohead protease
MELKTFSHVELKRDPKGSFVALISTFNKPDKFGDIVRPGAFRTSIARWRTKGAKVPVIFSHQSHDIHQHVGDVDPRDLVETSIGLQAAGQFYLTEPTAKKVHAQLLRKALSEWSFGFVVRQARSLPRGGRELVAVDLVEIGPTLAGAGETQTIDVKGGRHDRPPDPLAVPRAALDRALKRLAITIAIAR